MGYLPEIDHFGVLGQDSFFRVPGLTYTVCLLFVKKPLIFEVGGTLPKITLQLHVVSKSNSVIF